MYLLHIYCCEPQKPATWLLDELKLLKFGTPSNQEQCSSLSSETVNESTEVPVGASPEVAEIVASQYEEIPEVYSRNFLAKLTQDFQNCYHAEFLYIYVNFFTDLHWSI